MGTNGSRPNDRESLSKNPAQIRRRMRRGGDKLSKDVEIYAKVAWNKPLEDWDFEELARGRPRDKNGGFAGRTPEWIRQTVAKESKKRLIDKTYGLLATHVDTAVQVMGNLLISEEVDDKGRPLVDAKTKYAAAAFIIEHFIGKPNALVTVDVEGDEVKQALAAAIVLDDGKPQDVLEGEWEEVDDDDDRGE
jgi:hypothetical protein